MATDEKSFSEVMSFYKEKLDELLGDPLLCDLHSDVTLEEIKSLIELEHGQAMSVNIIRADGEIYSVVVHQNATLLDLKKALKRHMTLRQERNNDTTPISWKRIWKSYYLVFDSVKLKENQRPLKDYGLFNKCNVNFIKRLNER